MNAFFFCLAGTAVMGEFSYACPHGCCVSLLSPLGNVTIKGRKKIKGEREHSGASPQRHPRSLWNRARCIAPWLLLVFQGSHSNPFATLPCPLLHKSSQIFSNHYCTENEIKENLCPSLLYIYKLANLCFHFPSFITSQSKW